MAIKTQNLIVGAGIAGLVCALELLESGHEVLIVDAATEDKIGGQAKFAFGGMALVGTPEQKRLGIKDTPESAYEDWCRFAEFKPEDEIPRQWAQLYVEKSRLDIYDYIQKLGVRFLPAVNWVERGDEVKGNSLPRYHILWGCSQYLVQKLITQLRSFSTSKLKFRFNTKASTLIIQQGKVLGTEVLNQVGETQEIIAENTIIACGGFSGDISKVKKNWPLSWGRPPEKILNGSLFENDGCFMEAVGDSGAQLTHLDKMWNYAAGVPNPKNEFEKQGLSLIPCKSALWLDATGNRFSPPLVTGFDTYDLCYKIAQTPYSYSWQILNRRIALKELAVSGCDYNQNIRDRSWTGLIKDTVFGNKELVERLIKSNEAFVTAENLSDLIDKMNLISDETSIDKEACANSVKAYDRMVSRDTKFWNDEQIRKIIQLRKWKSERLRTCYPKPIEDGSTLIAIKLNLISRKCLGGIKTNIDSRVLGKTDEIIEGLYAIGEAAGFGGGGASGKRSLEGTFLSGCILTARQAARFISKN